MRETRQSGSEGGGDELNHLSLPLSSEASPTSGASPTSEASASDSYERSESYCLVARSRCSMSGSAASTTSPTTCRLSALTFCSVSLAVCQAG
jgi:hypothetical protein